MRIPSYAVVTLSIAALSPVSTGEILRKVTPAPLPLSLHLNLPRTPRTVLRSPEHPAGGGPRVSERETSRGLEEEKNGEDSEWRHLLG